MSTISVSSTYPSLSSHVSNACLALVVCVACCTLTRIAWAGFEQRSNCEDSYDPDQHYPLLFDPHLGSPTASVGLYLRIGGGTVYIEGCFYDFEAPLTLTFPKDLEFLRLEFEAPDFIGSEALLFVFEERGIFDVVNAEDGRAHYEVDSERPLGFELATPEQPAPTTPVVIVKPVEDDPDPQ